jgi:hypothetical protein
VAAGAVTTDVALGLQATAAKATKDAHRRPELSNENRLIGKRCEVKEEIESYLQNFLNNAMVVGSLSRS